MLPDDTPNSMLYAPKTLRGLGILNAQWEASIQHFNICNSLISINDAHLHKLRHLSREREHALNKLHIPLEALPPNTKGRHIREILRTRSFQSWCQLPHKGKGVMIYGECPKFNSWISRKKNLSSSEFINAVKMSCNVTAVRSVPGRTYNTTRFRHPGCNETETLGHVLRFCKKSELLRNNRHHKTRSAIASVLQRLGWEVHEEIHCISTEDSNRRADIIAINRTTLCGLVLDPTTRFERDTEQARDVDLEKKTIYEPCVPFLSEKYNIPPEKWTVQGLLFGSRGSLPKFTYTILHNLGLTKYVLQEILVQILKDSVHILQYHLYFKN